MPAREPHSQDTEEHDIGDERDPDGLLVRADPEIERDDQREHHTEGGEEEEEEEVSAPHERILSDSRVRGGSREI